MSKFIHVIIAFLVLMGSQPLCLADDIPLWEKRQQHYMDQYKAADYPGQERRYKAELAKARAANLRGEPLAVILCKVGYAIFNQIETGDYCERAEPYYKEALEIRQHNPVCNTKDLADNYYRYGFCLYSRAQRGDKSYLRESMDLFQKSIDLLKAKYGPQCPELAPPISGLSAAYMVGGNWEKAAQLDELLTPIYAKQFGANSEVLAAQYRGMSAMNDTLGHWDKMADAKDKYNEIKAHLPPGSLPPDTYKEWTEWSQKRLFSREKPTWMVAEDGQRHQDNYAEPPAVPHSHYNPPASNYGQPAARKPYFSSSEPEKPSSSSPVSLPPQRPGARYYVGGKEVSYEKYCASKLFNESLKLLAQKRTEEAEQKLVDSIKLSPDLTEAHCSLGLILAEQGNYGKALAELRKAVQIDENMSEAWSILANIYQSMGYLSDAIHAYQQFAMLANDPTMADRAQSAVRLLQKQLDESHMPSKLGNFPGADGKGDYLADITRKVAARWPDNYMPIKVYVHVNSVARGYQPDFDNQLKQSFEDWSNATNGKLSFSYVDSVSKANIEVMWTSDVSQFNESAEGGEALTQWVGSKINHCRILLMTCKESSKQGFSSSRIRAVALHEVGHSLGLLGHSPVPEDIMYCAEGLAEAPQNLTDRDKKTMKLLYSWQP